MQKIEWKSSTKTNSKKKINDMNDVDFFEMISNINICIYLTP